MHSAPGTVDCFLDHLVHACQGVDPSMHSACRVKTEADADVPDSSSHIGASLADTLGVEAVNGTRLPLVIQASALQMELRSR